jgi:very-short-patch-repair endonuclease
MTQTVGSLVDNILANVVQAKKFATNTPRDRSTGKQRIQGRISEALMSCSATQEDTYHRLKDCCESPIECLAFVALLCHFPTAHAVRKRRALREIPEWRIAIVPQMWHAGYRLDFAVIRRDIRATFALECDGRKFHRHNSKRDNDRTVDLWKSGVLVCRADGSALYRNPIAAIEPFVWKVRSNG